MDLTTNIVVPTGAVCIDDKTGNYRELETASHRVLSLTLLSKLSINFTLKCPSLFYAHNLLSFLSEPSTVYLAALKTGVCIGGVGYDSIGKVFIVQT